MSWADIRYGWIFFWSAVGLFLERFWHAFWPALSVLALFIGLACLNFFVLFGSGMHFFLLFAFVAGFALSCTRLGTPFRFPRAREVRRAIELESALRHRPLEAVLDRPVEGTHEAAHRLWSSYQERLQRLRESVKTYRPKLNATPQDPYALRIAAIAVMLLGLAVAQHEAPYRIREGLFVDVTQWIKPAPIALDAWIVPPDYTHQNPVFLATTQLGAAPVHGPVTVPENSVLKVRLSGYNDPPTVTYAGAPSPAFTQAASRSFTMEMPLVHDGDLKIRKGWLRTLGEWPVTVTPDAAPQIALLGTEKGDRATLKIKYKVSDDYGVKKIYGEIFATDKLRKTAFGSQTIDFDIPVPDDMHKDEQIYVADLAWHPWAGSPVMLTLSAEDDAGHTTSTPPQKIILPERDFKNPTAQAIIAERKRLIWYDNLITERLVATALANIASKPQDYKYDQMTFLGLDVATKRLVYDGSPESVQSDIALLWDLAVRVEDGGLSLAGRELSDALQRLSDALKDKSASKEHIQDLMDQVRQKAREYMKTLAQEMQQRMQEGQQSPQLSQALVDKLMKRVDMDKLMQQLREMTQGSQRDQMEKMAQFMKNAVDNFDPEKLAQMQKAQQKQMKALNDLDQLIQRQQSLLDHTNKMQPKPGQQQPQQQPQDQQQQSGGQQDQNQSGQQSQQEQQQQGGNGQQHQQGGENQGPQQGGQSRMSQQGQPQGQPGPQGQAGQQGQAQQQPGGQTPGTQGPQGTQDGGNGAQQQAAGGKFPDVKTPKQGAAEQGTIRNGLGDVLRSLGAGMETLPPQFSNADQGMKASQNALKQGDPQSSATQQREVLKNLQGAEDSALAQMAKGLQAMLSMGFMPGNGEGGYGEGFDPFGRSTRDGGNASGDIKLPDEKQRRRVQQIIEELRSRSNDYQRPKIERDYIDRLLQQFD